MKEIETVVTQKHEFDNRDESRLLTSFIETSDYQDFYGRIRKTIFQ